MADFDVVVIGGGPAGEHFAGKAQRAGLQTALIEEALVGGECSYWACMPSKTLLRPGRVLAAARAVPGASQAASGEIDVDAALARRDWMTAGWDDAGQASWLANAGVTLLRGHGRLVAEREVEVEAKDASYRVHARRAVVLATGSRAVMAPIPGLTEARAWDSRAATSTSIVPERLVVLGGGVVGVELAQAFRRLGAREVTIVEAAERLLANFEPFVATVLETAFRNEGITVVTGTKVTSVRRDPTNGPVTTSLEDGRELVSDELLVATGRRSRTADVGLEVLGLSLDHAVAVDASMRVEGTSGDWLYAIGDVNGEALLTHMGKYQARCALDAIVNGVKRPLSAPVTAVVFTDPEIATVGMTEREARDDGHDVVVVNVATNAPAAAAIIADVVVGSCQLVIDRPSTVILGATFVGPDIAELLHSATVAITGAVPLSVLRHAVPAYPTLSEIWLELLDSFFDAESAHETSSVGA